MPHADPVEQAAEAAPRALQPCCGGLAGGEAAAASSLHQRSLQSGWGRGQADGQANKLFEQKFERQLDQLIGTIRRQCEVTEKSMDASFQLYENDPEVQRLIQHMRSESTLTSGIYGKRTKS